MPDPPDHQAYPGFPELQSQHREGKNVLSFHPADDLKSIVLNLIDNMDKFQDWDNPLYSNIATFKAIESGIEIHAMAKAL